MKLLFDQNLSFILCQALADLFPGRSQVRLLGLAEADDTVLWQHAKGNGFALMTQDSDFADMAALYGLTPKVIWPPSSSFGPPPTDYRLPISAVCFPNFRFQVPAFSPSPFAPLPLSQFQHSAPWPAL